MNYVSQGRHAATRAVRMASHAAEDAQGALEGVSKPRAGTTLASVERLGAAAAVCPHRLAWRHECGSTRDTLHFCTRVRARRQGAARAPPLSTRPPRQTSPEPSIDAGYSFSSSASSASSPIAQLEPEPSVFAFFWEIGATTLYFANNLAKRSASMQASDDACCFLTMPARVGGVLSALGRR